MIATRLTKYGFLIAASISIIGVAYWDVVDLRAQGPAAAEEDQASDRKDASTSPKDQPEKKDPSTTETTQFAPGIVTVIPPAPEPEETVSGPQSLSEFLETYPEIKLGRDTHPGGEPHFDPRSRTLHEMAKQVFFRREIYCFEFSFKPLRHIYIDLKRADGRTQRKLIWYLVYRVRYRGGDLRPGADKVAGGDVYKRVESVHYDARYFFPMMKLRDQTSGKEYLDRVLPGAIAKIKIREQISADLHNSVEMGKVKIPYGADSASPGVWGVATWEDIDPTLDFVSIEVYGLTNAFQQDGEGDDAPYRRKVLQLNFYRPGDTINQTDDRIRFGVPAYEDKQQQEYVLKQYDLTERLDYRWLFR